MGVWLGRIVNVASRIRYFNFSLSLTDIGQTEKEWKEFTKTPRPYGVKLFQALFKDSSKARTAFDELSKQSARGIVLVLESPELDGVAWEYTFNEIKQEYIVEDFTFARALPENERPANRRLKNELERVPLLFIPANPLVDLSGEPMRLLDVEGEWQEIVKHIEASNAGFDLLQLRPPTPEALQTIMARFQGGMLAHFSGHGTTTKDGAFLLFEEKNGASNPLKARDFIQDVKDKAWIVFLSACQSASPEKTEFSNLARELVKAGVPFALGMQFNLPDIYDDIISAQFYNYLVLQHSVLEATLQARRALKRAAVKNANHEFYIGMIALYAAHPDEFGKLTWHGSSVQTLQMYREADVRDIPSPAGKLIGRQRELMQIGTKLLENKTPLTLTLHGAGGIGKTALLRQTLLRFAPSFELTLALALDPLPALETVLGRIENVLGLPSPCAIDAKERETIIQTAITSQRTLLGLDNFETLIHALNNQNSEDANTAVSLHEFFSSLCASGVVLCATSRQDTELPGEDIFEIYGLQDKAGGDLFLTNIGTRQGTLTEKQAHEISAAVGGHPLALRLLGGVYKKRADLTPDEFVKKTYALLAETKNQWTKTKRHASLEACFAFSMDNLPMNEEGKALQLALLRLSIYSTYFAVYTAAPTLAGAWPQSSEEDKAQQENAQRLTHALWERGLLERLTIPLREENFYLYRLHPALNQFATNQVTPQELPSMQATFQSAMQYLARRAYPASTGGGIYSSPFLVMLVRFALPDFLKATTYMQDKETSTLLFHTAFIQRHFGDLDGAMKMYQQSLEIKEGLGNLQGKSATLHAMAYILRVRGDLDGAMKMYQQAQEILEGLGDLKGKASTLAMLGQLYLAENENSRAITVLVESLQVLSSIGAQPDAQKVAEILVATRGKIGSEIFDSNWIEITGSPLPDWLSQNPEQGQGMTAEQFIAGAIQSAREKRPDAEKYFQAAQRMAGDTNAPPEYQELGKALQRVMLGDSKVDLSTLPPELASLIQKELG